MKTYLRKMLSNNKYVKAIYKTYEDNTEYEILDSVKELMERDGCYENKIQRDAKKLLHPSSYNYAAQGNFSTAILSSYFRAEEC